MAKLYYCDVLKGYFYGCFEIKWDLFTETHCQVEF